MDKFRITARFPVGREELFNAWLDSEKHSAFTGGKASVEKKLNGKHTAWDGYITGRIISLTPFEKVVMKWRTLEFQDDNQDSVLELLFEELSENESRLTVYHHHIPKGQGNKYKKGWKEHYFEPMAEYFGPKAATS